MSAFVFLFFFNVHNVYLICIVLVYVLEKLNWTSWDPLFLAVM